MMWLNLAGRVTLIKALLSALPIYQYAIIMASASAHKQMELIIRSFLWQGGKQDNKKFNLVRWEQVALPYEKGGITIRLPGLMNISLGTKIIWRMINGNGHWWEKVLTMKYLNCHRTKLLTDTIPDRPCTQIWKLVKRIISLIRYQISKNPRNGKIISIWEDRIMGKNPLNQQQNLRGLQRWMEEQSFNTLYSISDWDQNKQVRWKKLATPPRVKIKWEILKVHLARAAPVNKGEQDDFVWDPNGGDYTVKLRYNLLQKLHNQNDWSLRKVAWKSQSLPKIKVFTQTLLKGKILTSEN